MLLRPVFAALALALFCAAASAQQNVREALTLDEAVSLAVKNSPAALAAEQDIIIARQRVSEARFMYMQQFTLSGTASKASLEYPTVLGPELGERFLDPAISETLYTMRVQGLQPLYTGGRTTNTLKLAKAAHSQARVSYEAVKAQAALGAKKAFYSLLYQRRLLEAAGGWLKRARDFNAGLRKDAFEELEASMLLSGLSDRARQAAKGEEAAATELLRVISREPGYKPVLDGALEPLPVEQDLSRSLVTAMETRPELRSELYRAQMDDIAVSMAMVRRYPNVYLGASYDVNAFKLSDLGNHSVRANNWLASLAIHLPLSYDFWTQVQQRRAQQRQGELKRLELQDKVRFEIMAAQKEALFWQDEAIKLAGETARLKAGFEAASVSARPTMAALRALCALSELQKKALDAVYAQLTAHARLEWARGMDFPGKH